MKDPLISIIIPIYNVEKYLNKCLTSIVNQTYRNLEIILIDDGSTDRCPELCDQWKDKDSRIIVLHKKNGGLSDARNKGLTIAQGEYISFIDSDDFVDFNFIYVLYKTICLFNSDLVQCAYKVVDEKYINSAMPLIYNIENFDKITSLQLMIQEKKLNQVVWNKLYKKELLDKIRFEYGKINEDEYFTYQIMAKCNIVTFVDIQLYFYVTRNDSIIRKQYTIKRLDGLEARIKQYIFFKEKFPELVSLQKKNVMFYILYSYQNVLKIKNNEDRNRGKKIIKNAFKYIKKDGIYIETTKKEKMWIIMMYLSITFTAKLRNKLKINI